MPAPTQAPPPGWYPAPDLPDAQRWWDGSVWTEHLAPRWPSAPAAPRPGSADQWILPTNCSWVAIVAGYLGLLSLILLPAPLALGFGIAALAHLRRRPDLGGRGRAWFAVIAGSLGCAAWFSLALWF